MSIETGGTIVGYAWYQNKSKAYYVMSPGKGIPLASAKTTYSPVAGFNGTEAAEFLTWAATKLGSSIGAVDNQFLTIDYAAWP